MGLHQGANFDIKSMTWSHHNE